MVNQLIDYAKILSYGLPVTLSLSAAAIVFAFIISVGFTLLLFSKNAFLITALKGYLIVFTGTPLLVQLFLIYYGPSQFPAISTYFPSLWRLISNPWFCAFMALTLNSAAYTTQLFYGAMNAIPQGLWNACQALGMNKRQTLRTLMPYALRRALSSYSNEVVFVVKGTALASTITLMDLMGYNQLLNGEYYDFSIFFITGSFYLIINSALSIFMRYIEKKALKFEAIK